MSEVSKLERIYPFFIVDNFTEDTDDGLRAFELKDHDGYVCVSS